MPKFKIYYNSFFSHAMNVFFGNKTSKSKSTTSLNKIITGKMVTLCNGKAPSVNKAVKACPPSWNAVFNLSYSLTNNDDLPIPIDILSNEYSKSNTVAVFRSSFTAFRIAKFTMFCKSAPENPLVALAKN